MHDIIREFGYLTLGSRLKRLGERLQADVSRYAVGIGLDVPAGLFPVLATLAERGESTISELVEALGVSQPGVTRGVARLAALQLVAVTRAHRDQRHKTVTLTARGRDVLERSRREMWPVVEAAVREMCEGLDGPLLEQLAAIEEALAVAPLEARVRRARDAGGAP